MSNKSSEIVPRTMMIPANEYRSETTDMSRCEKKEASADISVQSAVAASDRSSQRKGIAPKTKTTSVSIR